VKANCKREMSVGSSKMLTSEIPRLFCQIQS
jgi:hypothetical protein